jgi:hypothetical protein
VLRYFVIAGENCIISNFMACTPHQILLKLSYTRQWDGWGIWHYGYIRFGWKTLKERGPFEKEVGNVRIIFLKSQRCVMGRNCMDYLA